MDSIGLLQVLLALVLSLVLTPLILAGNFLVIWPFYRARRIRTPANSLLLSLAISDLISGLILPVFVLLEVFRDSIVAESFFVAACRLPLALMAVGESSSALLIVRLQSTR